MPADLSTLLAGTSAGELVTNPGVSGDMSSGTSAARTKLEVPSGNVLNTLPLLSVVYSPGGYSRLSVDDLGLVLDGAGGPIKLGLLGSTELFTAVALLVVGPVNDLATLLVNVDATAGPTTLLSDWTAIFFAVLITRFSALATKFFAVLVAKASIFLALN